MADHTLNAMRAAVRSMREVVIPSIDPGQPLALEQAGLVAKYLEFWTERIDVIAHRNRMELDHYLGLGEALAADAADVSEAIVEELQRALDRARAIGAGGAPELQEMRDATERLARVIVALVRTASETEHPAARRIEMEVVTRSRSLAAMHRSWFLPQGWEDRPTVPDFGELVRTGDAETKVAR